MLMIASNYLRQMCIIMMMRVRLGISANFSLSIFFVALKLSNIIFKFTNYHVQSFALWDFFHSI